MTRKIGNWQKSCMGSYKRSNAGKSVLPFSESPSSCRANERWCNENKDFLQAPPHPSPLPFQLHRTVFTNLPAKDAILYARQHLMAFMATHEVLPLLTSALYQDRHLPANLEERPKSETQSLVDLFRMEFCRRHGWPQEDPLEVIVDLGSRGGALNAVEKARKVIGQRLGDVRSWDELPVRQDRVLKRS